jgi:hypothetical protein
MSTDYTTSIIRLQFLGAETKLVLYSQLVKPYNMNEYTNYRFGYGISYINVNKLINIYI